MFIPILVGTLMLLVLMGGAKVIGAQGYGPLIEERIVVVTNRTGGTLTIGGCYALDVAQGDGDSTTIELGASGLVAVSTANLRAPKVIATKALLDNETGTAVLASNNVSALIEGTTDVAKGDSLIPINAQIYLKTQSALVTSPACGWAWEAETNAGPTLHPIAFNGLAGCFTTAPAS